MKKLLIYVLHINNKFNTESSIYYLLVQKMKKTGQDSVSDLSSKKYIDYIENQTNDILNYTSGNFQTNYDIEFNNRNRISDLKKYYNIFNSDKNINKYLYNFNLNSVPDFDKINHKFINI